MSMNHVALKAMAARLQRDTVHAEVRLAVGDDSHAEPIAGLRRWILATTEPKDGPRGGGGRTEDGQRGSWAATSLTETNRSVLHYESLVFSK